ncbi:MAG: DNA primase [Acidobacteria bacterium]|nr:DNA primase [Acidobacteriota bacterium]
MADFDLGPAVIARVRDAADILEVVGEHVQLRRQGRRWVGRCPFHQEKTPSFSVDPERGLYYCFGCHAGGDTIRFVMQVENLEFPQAVERLARRFGVELPPRTPAARRQSQVAEKVRGLLGEAQQWFADQLVGPAGAAARQELERRGFTADTWSELGFGFAPDEWRALLDHLKRRHPEGTIVDAGLAVVSDRSDRPYDRFRKRITFPIQGGDGRLVAFGGRILGDGEPKYLNSPEGPLFHKRSTLFLLHRARRPMAEAGHALIVEGYFDCLSLHRAGITQAVATLGTALTPDHARILRRLTSKVLLCYDADEAGRKAAVTGSRVLLEAGLEVGLLDLPAGRDPDDVVREDGVEAFRSLLESPVPVLDFLLGELPADPRERRRVGIEVAPIVGAARDTVVRFGLLEELARRLDLPLEIVQERARRAAPTSRPPAPAPAARQTTLPPGEREILRILLTCDPERRGSILPQIYPPLFAAPLARRLLELLREVPEDDDPVQRVIDAGPGEEITGLLAELTLGTLPPPSPEGTRAQLAVLLREQGKRRAAQLQAEIEAAAARDDTDEVARLQAEKRRIRLEIPKIG